MTTTDISLVWNYKNRPLNVAKEAEIHIKVYRFQRTVRIKRYIPTGVMVRECDWNAAKQEIKAPNSAEINKVLRDMVTKLRDYEYSLINKGVELTSSYLDDYLSNRHTSVLFNDFFANEIDPSLKRGTRKEHQYTLNLLNEFNPRIRFTDINLDFVQNFDRFLKYEKKLKTNTIYKHHQHINRFLRVASQKELFDSNKNPYQFFKTKKERGNRINLSPDEIMRIEQLPTQNTDIEKVRLMFLFSCYTGLRFSDVVTLTPLNIIRNADGIVIEKKMEKVPKPVVLPISLLFDGKAVPILEQFLRENRDYDKPIFPTLTNQYINRILKIIAISANIHMNLTFHIARHTFGSLLADLTQNPYLIMDLMGHEKIDTSMIYIHRSQERINKQLRVINWKGAF